MSEKHKKVLIGFLIALGATIVVFTVIFISYTQKLKEAAQISSITTNTINNIVDNEEDASMASTTEDLTVNEAMNETLENVQNETNETAVQGETSNAVSTSTTTQNTANSTNTTNTATTDNSVATTNENTVVEETTKKELSFIAPVSGEIITDYAKDDLIYSSTLEEWTTHLGIDIKADKTSIVVASEAGTVKSIKNDPRYGLTITILHDDGFETVYSNLLSSEFVSEGDTVTQGQTIGTVGDSASFEIAEVSHLHFEMYKDGESVNPTIYLND